LNSRKIYHLLVMDYPSLGSPTSITVTKVDIEIVWCSMGTIIVSTLVL